MSNDPWAAAGAQNGQQAQQNDSGMGEAYADEPSGLFGGGGGVGPSLLNKTHKVGTERTGIVSAKPFKRASTNMAGKPKFWQNGTGVVTEPNGPNGANKPLMDTIIPLDTEYKMDAAEQQALGRDEIFEGGQRSLSLSGDNLKKMVKAIAAYNAANPGSPITGDPAMVGKRITVKRVAEKPNPHGGDSIKVHEYVISNA